MDSLFNVDRMNTDHRYTSRDVMSRDGSAATAANRFFLPTEAAGQRSALGLDSRQAWRAGVAGRGCREESPTDVADRGGRQGSPADVAHRGVDWSRRWTWQAGSAGRVSRQGQ